MEFPSFFKCLEFVRCTSNSATLLMLTDANGDDTGALNNVFRVGRNASSTSSWFVLDGTGAPNVIRKWFYNPLWIGYKFKYPALFSDHNDNDDNDDSNNNGDDVNDVDGIKDVLCMKIHISLWLKSYNTLWHMFF